MKNLTLTKSGSLGRRLAKHFAALALPALIIPAAQAQIVWSGVVNLNVPSDFDGIYLNVLNGAWSNGPVPGWDVNVYSAAPSPSQSALAFWASSSGTTGGYVWGLGNFANRVDNLAPGTMIDASQAYGAGGTGVEITGPTAFLVNSSDNLVGFRFVNEGNGLVHYGWLRMSLSGTLDAQPRSIVDWAYESSPGAGIGAGIIPEPTAASLLLLGLGGLLGVRSLRRQ